MYPTLLAFLVASSLSLVPGGLLYRDLHQGPFAAYVGGSVAVAAATALSVTLARRRGWVGRIVFGGVTVAGLPLVAGVVTGFLAGCVTKTDLFEDPVGGAATGAVGAMILYVPLVLAAAALWGVTFGAHAFAEWMGRRVSGGRTRRWGGEDGPLGGPVQG